MRSGAVLLLCVLVLAGCARASSTPARPRGDALLEEVMDLSGTRRMLEQVPEQVLAGAAADRDRLPADVRARLDAALRAAYRADTLKRAAFDYLKKHARPDELAAALALLRSPVALRFTEMEVAAGTPEAHALVGPFVEGLATAPPPRARFDLLVRLDALSGTSALLTEISVQTAASVARGVASARSPLTPTQADQLAAMVRQMREQAGPATRHQVITMFLFTYRKASDEDLAKYVAMYETPGGEWLARTTGAAAKVALEQAAVDLARRLTAK